MREDEVRQENEKYYYGHYIWDVRFRKWGPFLCVAVMAWLSINIKNLFLKQFYFRQAGTVLIPNDMDVMEWVNMQMEENRWDGMFFLIIGISLIMVITIVWTTHGIKSYNFYKWDWIRVIPFALYAIEFAVMCLNYYRKTDLLVLLLSLIFNLAPALAYSRLLYPLESRPPAKGEKSLQAMAELFTKWVIEKL